jgi:importin-5
MSVLPPDVHNELAQLLDALQSSDNSVRSQAEEHLANNWTTTKPELLLMGLVEQIQGSNDPTVHILARYVGFVSCADSFPPPRRDPLLQLFSVE